MKGDWRMIGRGMCVAIIGAVGAMLSIVSASAAFVGRPLIAVLTLMVACVAAVAFRHMLSSFLDAVDRRDEEIDLLLSVADPLPVSLEGFVPRKGMP
jgi:hypothetical protein